MADSTLDKVTNWTKPDNSLVTTYYIRKAMRNGETEDQFINRVNEKLMRERPEFKELPATLDNLSDLPDMSFREKFRRNEAGKIVIDHSIKTRAEVFAEQQATQAKVREALREKILKVVSDLTVEEVDLLIGKES